ncbi:DNA2/NAM7 HELICASE FAMILY [Salix koriyanagi]|uniref:DNA2/NAM7 HELICASE FAMILY n=1 Tax=Salix koriyanagi TaxID=2511006 RepID=A0A9Q0P7W9_9ROSI|nr:DNA2/NAM7 HELICASE FAMILY [Salix koriyanagi]
MSTGRKDNWDDEYSIIGDKGEIGFIDFEDDKSVCNYDAATEGPIAISIPFPFVKGKPQSILVGEISKCGVTVANTTSDPGGTLGGQDILLKSCRLVYFVSERTSICQLKCRKTKWILGGIFARGQSSSATRYTYHLVILQTKGDGAAHICGIF